MRWSQMNAAQREFLLSTARFNRDVFDPKTQRVRKGEPRNDAARVMVAAKALDRDWHEQRQAMVRAEHDKLIAEYDGPIKTDHRTTKVSKLVIVRERNGCVLIGRSNVKVRKVAVARGAGELQRKRGGSMLGGGDSVGRAGLLYR